MPYYRRARPLTPLATLHPLLFAIHSSPTSPRQDPITADYLARRLNADGAKATAKSVTSALADIGLPPELPKAVWHSKTIGDLLLNPMRNDTTLDLAERIGEINRNHGPKHHCLRRGRNTCRFLNQKRLCPRCELPFPRLPASDKRLPGELA